MTSPAARYWESRAQRFGEVDRGLPAVCSYGMPRLYNEAIHLAQKAALAPHLRFRGKKVLDVGCGVGRWSLRLAARGNDVLGVDIAGRMVGLARQRCASLGLDARFAEADLQSLDLGERFDVIVSVTVLQHVMGESGVRRAIERLYAHLRDGGRLILLEAAPSLATPSCDSDVFSARTEGGYRALLDDGGFEVTAVSGVDIAPLRPVLLPLIGNWQPTLARMLTTLSAVASVPVDLALAPLLPRASWHKIFVARKRP